MARRPLPTFRAGDLRPRDLVAPAASRPAYRAEDWFWIVGGDESQVYASGRLATVPLDDPAYQAFLAAGGRPSRIASRDELAEVLLRYGIVMDAAAQYRDARALQYLKALSKSGPAQARFQEVIGDVVDVLIRQVAALVDKAGVEPTPEFADLVATVGVVKAAFPRPQVDPADGRPANPITRIDEVGRNAPRSGD